uniref:Uncharacterized protein n=1 Tax=Arundo donax TaxID=35708 RepID=A0A0A9FHW7_ARUDO
MSPCVSYLVFFCQFQISRCPMRSCH